jgi:hypothetical protein
MKGRGGERARNPGWVLVGVPRGIGLLALVVVGASSGPRVDRHDRGAGSHYRSFVASSHADWARWATHLDAFRPPAHRRGTSSDSSRFFIWQAGDHVPGEYACAVRVASYTAPALHLNRLGPLRASWDVGFPSTDLYHLPPECPVGYDPTGTRTE